MANVYQSQNSKINTPVLSKQGSQRFSKMDSQISLDKSDDNKQSAAKKSKSSFFKSMLTTKQKEFDFGSKSKEGQIEALMYLLTNYDGIQNHIKLENFNPLDIYKPKLVDYKDLTLLRPELQYYMAIISKRELHDFYVDFYATFDSNKNFQLDAGEFRKLMLTASEKILGPKKFKFFGDLCPGFKDRFEVKLDDKMITELFEAFRDMEQTQQEALDYLMLFPYLLSFFFEYNLSQITYRLGRLDLMRGTELVRTVEIVKDKEVVRSKEVEIKNIHSLLTIQREMGIEYLRDKYTYCLSFRDVENLLIKFKNIQKWITFDIIKQILGQLEKIMRVDERTRIEGRKMKLHKIINFLTLKLCVHQNCQYEHHRDKKKTNTPSVYLEILVLWNTAMHFNMMVPDRMREKFATYAHKKYTNKETISRVDAQRLVENFFKKDFQLMPKDKVKNIILKHPQLNKDQHLTNPQISLESLIDGLHQMICAEGYELLEQYIGLTLEGVTKRNKGLLEQYKNQGKDIEEPRQLSGVNSPKSGLGNTFRSPDFLPANSQDQLKSEAAELIEDEQEEEDEETPKSGQQFSMVKKFRKAVNIVKAEQAFSKVQPKKQEDMLKACLIMDSFIQRQTLMYQNKQTKIHQSQYKQAILDQHKSKVEQEQMLAEAEKQAAIDLINSNRERENQLFKQSMLEAREKEKADIEAEEKLKFQQFKQSQQENEAKESQRQEKKPILQDVGNDQIANHEAKFVLGKQEDLFGPSNMNNAKLSERGHLMSSLNAKVRTIGFIGTKTNATDEEFKVTINEAELRLQLDMQSYKQQKSRDNCQCILM